MTKYHAKKTTVFGLTFDSKHEAERYLVLRSMFEAREITDLKIVPLNKDELTFVLQPGFKCKYTGKYYRPITYIADSSYFLSTNLNQLIVEDAKGYRPEVFRIKEKLFRYRYPGIILKLT